MIWQLPFIHKNAPLCAKSSRIQNKVSKISDTYHGSITVFISCFRTYAFPLDLRHDSMLTKIWTISHGKITDFGSKFIRRLSGGFIRRFYGGLF